MKGTKKNKWDVPRMMLTAVITVVVVMALRILVFASFRIPSFSMEPTLHAGDFILVNKLIPGPRIDFMGKRKNGRPFRLAGYRALERNEVLVFNDPYYQSDDIVQNWNIYYVKRCVGTPGDSLIIQEGEYYINGKLNIDGRETHTNKQQTSSVAPEYQTSKMFRKLGWTIDDFGPIYIPQKGDVIILDTVNISLYRPLIEYETGKKLVEMNGVFLLDGQVSRHYKFKLDYYFMAGDRTSDSKDSRYWGLLPEDHIVGKVSYIWKSKDPGTNTYRFERFFKPVE